MTAPTKGHRWTRCVSWFFPTGLSPPPEEGLGHADDRLQHRSAPCQCPASHLSPSLGPGRERETLLPKISLLKLGTKCCESHPLHSAHAHAYHLRSVSGKGWIQTPLARISVMLKHRP